jgi:DNA-binding transcriptional LysR family regulator
MPLVITASGSFSGEVSAYYLRIQASLTVTSLQQEGIDIAIRMGQGNWEGVKAITFFPMSLLGGRTGL